MKYYLTISICCILIFAVTAISHADIGIIVALNSTVEDLKKAADIKTATKKSGRDFFAGTLGGERIILVRSPMGKVNNAITAQTLLSCFPVDVVYSISPAGALSENFGIGDVVVVTNAFQHDFGTIKPYGFIWSKVPTSTDATNQQGEDDTLDPSLITPVLNVWKKMKTHHKMAIGILVSGDQFIASRDKNEWLEKKFAASAVDMGGAAIVQTCLANQVPCCLLRIITDEAGVEARGDFNAS
ncbi:MAG: 5'-methylthioadenosine/S-adenosylhomocysteine nucleosidase, partial [Proteobacteria bacterium]|nr:5'-methylthioadenosine/S-adenosylhomocysteine nucleosidase [Desulfobulbaceae bacterium]MBU4153716.1 5'-methylthioadenosine/S-adenosylhomocysteine nucleosidase [Pseudomonadota bacterium]